MRRGVFICHASVEAALARRVVEVLEEAGVPCWIAPRDIEAGSNFTHAILEGLAAAPAMVLMFSAAADASPHVRRELEMAVGSDTPLLPVRLEDVSPSPTLRYFIGTSQWLDAFAVPTDQWESAVVRAAQRLLETSADSLPAPAPASPAPDIQSPPEVPRARIPTLRGRTWGRDRVIAEVVDLLTDGGEVLVTLTGLGGIGKTRVATAVATELQRAGNEVHFLTRAALDTADQLTRALTELAPGPDAVVVLDELDAGPEVLDLIDELVDGSTAPALLVTSRLPLGLSLERALPLPPLDVPRRADDTEAVLASPAVQLFLAAAARTSSSFRVSGHEPTVGELCRLLDGIPLALELCAARLRVHGLERLAASLTSTLELVSTSQSDVPERHRSLTTVIAWSVDRLAEAEARVFERLSVFEGGFTLDAAEAACAGLATADALDPILEAGLLRLDDSGPEVRYVLPHPVRLVARARWESGGDVAEVREAVAAHLLARLQEWTGRLDTAEGSQVLARFGGVATDVVASIDAALLGDRLPVAIELTLAASPFWVASGRLSEPLALTRRVLGEVSGDHPAAAGLHVVCGLLAYHLSEYALAADELGTGLRMAEERDEPATLAAARTYLGGSLVMSGRRDEGAELARQGFADAERLDLYPLAAVALAMVAISHAIVGELDEERRAHERRLDLVRRRGDLARTANSLNILAEIALDGADAAKAHRYASESLALALDQLPLERRDASITLARAAAALGRHDEARRSLGDALASSGQIGQHLAVSQCLRVGGVLAVSDGDPALAVRLFAAAQTLTPSPTGGDEPPEEDLAQALVRARGELDPGTAEHEWTLGAALPLTTILGQLRDAIGRPRG